MYDEADTTAIDPVKKPTNEAIVIAVDGSSYAESVWLYETNEVSRIAQAVFAILDSLSNQGHTFYLHFLSTREPELIEVNRFPSAVGLEEFLQPRRRELHLPLRGNFLAPVVQWWQNVCPFPKKRLIVLSNGPVYDYKDIDLSGIFCDYTWLYFHGACPRYRPDSAIFALGDQARGAGTLLRNDG